MVPAVERVRKELVREIRAAFMGAERPETESDDLDADALGKRLYRSKYLEPPAYRWFIRSLLFELLGLHWERYDTQGTLESQLIHSAVYWLRPNPARVLSKRTDDDVSKQLSRAQRVCVARFLGMIIASSAFTGRGLRYLAAQAIEWDWRDDPAVLATAEALRAEARSFHPRQSADRAVADVVRQIEIAFAETPKPPAPLLEFHDEEGSEYELELATADWKTMQPWLLGGAGSAICWMTPEAVRYFIPAAMRADVLRVGGLNTVHHLSRKGARAALFTPAERVAVTLFLRHELRDWPERLRDALAKWS